jgi:hypothetical protein
MARKRCRNPAEGRRATHDTSPGFIRIKVHDLMGGLVTLLRQVKRPFRPAFRRAIQLNVALNRRKYRYVFILAHMRSGSTLLSHILASHPNFVQAGESYITYRTSADLQNLVVETCRRLQKIYLRATYIADKIVYDGYITDEILKSPLIHKCVILVRSPEAALQSMIDHYGWQEKLAVDTYINRLESLVRHGLILRERALLVEYDDLIDHTEKSLAKLTEFFGETRPFESNYKTNRMTGHPVGDASINIFAGRVIRTQPHKIDIGVEALAKASTAFRNCRQRLLFAGVQLANETLPS